MAPLLLFLRLHRHWERLSITIYGEHTFFCSRDSVSLWVDSSSALLCCTQCRCVQGCGFVMRVPFYTVVSRFMLTCCHTDTHGIRLVCMLHADTHHVSIPFYRFSDSARSPRWVTRKKFDRFDNLLISSFCLKVSW